MTINEKLEAYFKARPGLWIDGMQLAEVAGQYAWRSRCSDLRTHRGMTIENRQRRLHVADRHYIVSEYRYVEARPLGQATLFEANA